MNPNGLRVARDYALWYIGDSTWADLILEAYEEPEIHEALLNREKKNG